MLTSLHRSSRETINKPPYEKNIKFFSKILINDIYKRMNKKVDYCEI